MGKQQETRFMMKPHTLASIIRRIDTFSEWIGRGIAWLTLLMVLITFSVAVLRYLFNIGWIAMQESVVYLHSFVFLLGAAYTLKHDGHVRVDIMYRPLGERGKALVNLFGTLVLLLPVSLFMLWICWDYVAASWSILEGSQEAGGIEARYLLKSSLLLMPALMVLQSIAELLRNGLTLAGYAHLTQPQPDHSL